MAAQRQTAGRANARLPKQDAALTLPLACFHRIRQRLNQPAARDDDERHTPLKTLLHNPYPFFAIKNKTHLALEMVTVRLTLLVWCFSNASFGRNAKANPGLHAHRQAHGQRRTNTRVTVRPNHGEREIFFQR